MSIPLRVLLVEDSEDDALLLERELKRGGYEPTTQRVQTEKAMSAELEPGRWDIVISDYVMPRFSGMDAFRVLKDSGLDLPFIMISGKMGEETAVDAMRAGVHDYIMKDKLARLIPAIQRELREADVRKEHKAAQEALEESEKRFALFMSHLPGLAYIKDEEGKILYVNEYVEKSHGRKMGKVLGKTDFDLWPEELASKMREDDQQAISGGKVVESIHEAEQEGEKVAYLSYRFPIVREGWPTLLGAISIDITERKRAEDLLKETTAQLQLQREALERKNVALKEILNQIDAEKDAIKKQITTNVEQAIVPTVLRLKELSAPGQAKSFEMLERDLKEIVSPFVDTIRSAYAKLSPRELEICRLIKNGMSSKEIAEALNLAVPTVHKYRELIRRKLKLTNTEANLNTFLQSV
jgi:two-component system sensor histidine kinase UhpB